MILAIVGDIAVQFEIAPIGLQLRAESPDMANGAGLAGLDRVRRNRERWAGPQGGKYQMDQKCRANGSRPDHDHCPQRPLLVGAIAAWPCPAKLLPTLRSAATSKS